VWDHTRIRQQMIAGIREPLEQSRQIDPNQLTVVLDDATGDEHRIDIGRVGANHYGRDRIDDRRHVDLIGADQNDIGLFAWRDRADLVIECTGAGAIDGGELEHVAMRQRWRKRRIGRLGEGEDALLDEGRSRAPLASRRTAPPTPNRPSARSGPVLHRWNQCSECMSYQRPSSRADSA
jgi:hypothetical protein